MTPANPSDKPKKDEPAADPDKDKPKKFEVPGNPGLSIKEYDDLYSKQVKDIKTEVEKEPLVSDVLDINFLLGEYDENQNFFKKIKFVSTKYNKKKVRKVRRDGSCFYRSFIYRLSEILIKNPSLVDSLGLLKRIAHGTEIMKKAGFDPIVFEDFEDGWKEFLVNIKEKKTNFEILPAIFCDKMYYDCLVMYLRFIISAFIRTSPLFEAYFETKDARDIFCKKDVEPIDCEADSYQILALFHFFEVPLRIFYVDNTPGEETTVLSLPEIDKGADQVLKTDGKYFIQLLYRPGHYDILY